MPNTAWSAISGPCYVFCMNKVRKVISNGCTNVCAMICVLKVSCVKKLSGSRAGSQA